MVSLGLGDGLEGLRGVGTHGDLCHVDIAIGHGNLSKALLLNFLAGSRELRDLADVGSLGGLSAGVGVNLGIENKDVDVLVLREDMIHAAKADVVCPAVAAEDPDGLLGQIFLILKDLCRQLAGVAGAAGLQALLQSCDVSLGCFLVGLAVFHGVEPLLCGFLQRSVGPVDGDQLAGLVRQRFADDLLRGVHAVAVLRIILEQGVGPCRAATLFVGAVGGSCAGAAPDGGTTGGVGNVHTVAEELGDQTCVAGFGAACAGTGELKQRLLELAALDGQILDLVLRSDLGNHVVEHVLLCQLALLRDHGDGLGRADADADAAAHAVQRGNGHGELIDTLALAGLDRTDLCALGSGSGLSLGEHEGTDGGVRADKGAVVALDALVGVPFGNGDGNAALLVSGSAQLKLAVHMIDEGGNRQAVAVHLVDGEEDVLDHLHEFRLALKLVLDDNVLSGGPGSGNLDLDIGGGAGVDGVPVLLDNVHALLGVGMLGSVLHVLDGVCFRHDLGQREEGGLEDGVGALAHADLDGKVNGVDGVELNVVLCDVALRVRMEVMLQLGHIPLAVDQEHAAGLDVVDDLEALGDVGRVVAGDEVGLVDVVRTLDGLVTEAQVADGHAAGLLGVVLEICLNIFIGVVADDLDGVLVCADGAVAAQTPELALDGAFCRGVGRGLLLEGQMSHIVMDAEGELTLRLVLCQLFVDGKDGCGRRVLGAQTIASADDGDHAAGVCQSGDNVQVQRLAQSARLLGAVENGDLLAGSGDGFE